MHFYSQMMYINDVESQLEESRGMLSQQAAQMEEREQDIEDLRQLLAQVSLYIFCLTINLSTLVCSLLIETRILKIFSKKQVTFKD